MTQCISRESNNKTQPRTTYHSNLISKSTLKKHMSNSFRYPLTKVTKPKTNRVHDHILLDQVIHRWKSIKSNLPRMENNFGMDWCRPNHVKERVNRSPNHVI